MKRLELLEHHKLPVPIQRRQRRVTISTIKCTRGLGMRNNPSFGEIWGYPDGEKSPVLTLENKLTSSLDGQSSDNE